MNLLTKLMIAAGLLAALSGAGVAIHHSIYQSGLHDGEAKVRKEIDDARAEAARKNETIVAQDQELIVAKAQDKEKIVTIYRTIREQLDAQIIEVPVYRECRIPADGMRRIAAAARGDLPADPQGAAGSPASGSASAER